MLPFIKLKTVLNLPAPEFKNNLIFYGDQKSIGFFKIDPIIESQLLQIIPDEYRHYFSASIMQITTAYIRPHTDSDRKVGINFYVKTEKAITKFFNKIATTSEVEKVPGQTNGFVYQESELSSAGSFVAIQGDIWVLDVSKIHSVVNPTNSERIAYTLSSNSLSYTDTVKLLS
jgi:hypothetical protein